LKYEKSDRSVSNQDSQTMPEVRLAQPGRAVNLRMCGKEMETVLFFGSKNRTVRIYLFRTVPIYRIASLKVQEYNLGSGET
jgi:hypothetical protein